MLGIFCFTWYTVFCIIFCLVAQICFTVDTNYDKDLLFNKLNVYNVQ